jgi:pyridoxal biosynthesis lyase PdxS
MIKEIKKAVTIPVMAKARIGCVSHLLFTISICRNIILHC